MKLELGIPDGSLLGGWDGIEDGLIEGAVDTLKDGFSEGRSDATGPGAYVSLIDDGWCDGPDDASRAGAAVSLDPEGSTMSIVVAPGTSESTNDGSSDGIGVARISGTKS